MSKTDDTSNLATLEHHDTFADSELDAVTGGADPKVTARSRGVLLLPKSEDRENLGALFCQGG